MSGPQTGDESSARPVRIADNATPHSAVFVEENTPVIAGSAVYGFIPANFRTFTLLGGTAATDGREFKCSSGTSLGSYGVIQSFRAVNYRTGGSATIRCAGRFSTPDSLTWSGIGAISIGDEISFGYSGTTFGVWHRYGGLPEIRSLQVTGGASGGETATVTLNGTGYSVPLTSGSVQHNAYEIADWFADNVTAWVAEQVDDTVNFVAQSDGAKSDAYSFSSSTATATWSQTTAGVTKTSTHVPQTSWNVDRLEDLDPTLGNNYEIRYTNGYGVIEYWVECKRRCRYVKVHCIHYPNTSVTQNLGNPSLRAGMYATSISASSNNIDVYASYLTMFDTAHGGRIRNPRATSNTKSIDTTEINILTLLCRDEYNGYVNQAEIEPLLLSLSNDGNKEAIFKIRGNATFNGETNFQEVGTNLISLVDTAATTFDTGGRILAEFAVARLSNIVIDLTTLDIRVPPTLRLSITGNMVSGNAADLSAAITYYEDVY